MTREALLQPWLASHAPEAAERLDTLRGSPAYEHALEALEPRWFAWAIAQGAAWPRSRVLALFNQVDRLMASGANRHEAERTALAAALDTEPPPPPLPPLGPFRSGRVAGFRGRRSQSCDRGVKP